MWNAVPHYKSFKSWYGGRRKPVFEWQCWCKVRRFDIEITDESPTRDWTAALSLGGSWSCWCNRDSHILGLSVLASAGNIDVERSNDLISAIRVSSSTKSDCHLVRHILRRFSECCAWFRASRRVVQPDSSWLMIRASGASPGRWKSCSRMIFTSWADLRHQLLLCFSCSNVVSIKAWWMKAIW